MSGPPASSTPPRRLAYLAPTWRVTLTVGTTTWRTSVFPDSGAGNHLLPIKKAVRVDEGIEDGDEVAVSLRLLN